MPATPSSSSSTGTTLALTQARPRSSPSLQWPRSEPGERAQRALDDARRDEDVGHSVTRAHLEGGVVVGRRQRPHGETLAEHHPRLPARGPGVTPARLTNASQPALHEPAALPPRAVSSRGRLLFRSGQEAGCRTGRSRSVLSSTHVARRPRVGRGEVEALALDVAAVRLRLRVGVVAVAEPGIAPRHRDGEGHVDPDGRVPHVCELGPLQEDPVDEQHRVAPRRRPGPGAPAGRRPRR